MPPPQWRLDPRVIEDLLAEPYRYEFFQAVRLLARWFSEQDGNPGNDDLPEQIRFRNTLSMAFPPSEIEWLTSFDKAGEPLDAARQTAAEIDAGAVARIDLVPAFFGLLGNQGAMPLRYTEQFAEREQLLRDRTARAFFDVFSDRAAALFYAAWKKYRLPLHYELDRNEQYLPRLVELAGVGQTVMRESAEDEAGLPFDEIVAGHAAAVRHRPMSAPFLQQTLADHFGVPIAVEQLNGKWYDVAPEQQSQFGQQNMVLGATAFLGERIWQQDLRVRMVIGPLSRKEYDAFLPGRANARALEQMLTLLVGDTLEYEVLLKLKQAEVGGIQLGQGDRLGWDAFLATRPSTEDRAGASYEINAICRMDVRSK